MKKILLAAITLGLLLSLSLPVSALPLASPLQVTMQKWEKAVGNCPMEGAPKQPCIHLELKYPVFKGGDAALVKVLHTYTQDYLLNHLYEEEKTHAHFDELLKLLVDDRAETAKDIQGYPLPWDLSRTVQVEHQTPQLISLAAKEYRFLGGAHPTHYMALATFGRQQKRQLKWSDIVIAGQMNALQKMGEIAFRKQRELSPTASLAEAGFDFDKNRFALNDNWMLDKTGLRCYYNIYEITAYVMGPTEILIPYSQLKGILKPEWLPH